jgi:hypothetical protein
VLFKRFAQHVGIDAGDFGLLCQLQRAQRVERNIIEVVSGQRDCDAIDALAVAANREDQSAALVFGIKREVLCAGHCAELVAAELREDGLSDGHLLLSVCVAIRWMNYSTVIP